MTYFIGDIVLLFVILLLAAALVFLLDVAGIGENRKPSQREIERQIFTNTCTSKGGVTVWNGRNWECLK